VPDMWAFRVVALQIEWTHCIPCYVKLHTHCTDLHITLPRMQGYVQSPLTAVLHVRFYLFKPQPIQFRVTFLCSSSQFTQNVDKFSSVVRTKAAWVPTNTGFKYDWTFWFLEYNRILLKLYM